MSVTVTEYGAGMVQSADKYCMHEIRQNGKENPTCCLPFVTEKILSMASNVESAQQLDPVTLFSLIQEAHNRKMKSVMDLTCCTLVNKVHTKTSVFETETKTSVEFKIDQKYVHNKYCNRLRSHRRETFIRVSDVCLDYRPALTCTATMIKNVLTSMEQDLEYDDRVNEFMESSKFVVCDKMYRDFKKLNVATERLHKLICEDKTLARVLSYNVVERLVQIFDVRDLEFSQRLAANILLSAIYHECSNLIKEQAIPFLVKLMNSRFNQLAKKVVITLTSLACASPDYIKVIVDNRALEVAHEVVAKSTKGGFDVVQSLAMFLAVVCRANNLSPDKEKVVINISQILFQKKWYTSSATHINRACYALSYLSYERPVEFTKQVCECLVKFLSHDDKSVVASALGVVGNVVRWGYGYQIQYLTEDFGLVDCLGKSILCSEFKKFRKEACQIISNLAARSKASIKDEAVLIESMCKLLEKDEPDVKMEAAWAIFNGIYAL